MGKKCWLMSGGKRRGAEWLRGYRRLSWGRFLRRRRTNRLELVSLLGLRNRGRTIAKAIDNQDRMAFC